MKTKKPFMTCEWKHLVIISYYCDPLLLEKYLPQNIVIDKLNDKAVVSVVAFTFSKARMFGCRIPFHQHFPEINLRTYVKDKITGKRGVLFLEETAPKRIVAAIAKHIYNEPFKYGDIVHTLYTRNQQEYVNYKFITSNAVIGINTQESKNKEKIDTESVDFIVKRKVAFVKSKYGNSAKIYRLVRPDWEVLTDTKITYSKLVGASIFPTFDFLFAEQPFSCMYVKGSAVEVYKS